MAESNFLFRTFLTKIFVCAEFFSVGLQKRNGKFEQLESVSALLRKTHLEIGLTPLIAWTRDLEPAISHVIGNYWFAERNIKHAKEKKNHGSQSHDGKKTSGLNHLCNTIVEFFFIAIPFISFQGKKQRETEQEEWVKNKKNTA